MKMTVIKPFVYNNCSVTDKIATNFLFCFYDEKNLMSMKNSTMDLGNMSSKKLTFLFKVYILF